MTHASFRCCVCVWCQGGGMMGGEGMEVDRPRRAPAAPVVDADGWTTVPTRRSSRLADKGH